MAPDDAVGGVAVALDEAGEDHAVGETVVELGCEVGDDLGPAIAEDAAVAHRDMGAAGEGGVQGDDLAGDEDGGWHGRDSSADAAMIGRMEGNGQARAVCARSRTGALAFCRSSK